MKKSITLLLIAGILFHVVTIKNVSAQWDSLFWNPDMIAIAKPSSKQGWVKFKDGSNIAPTTVFTTHKDAFGLSTDDQMVLIKTETDQLGYTHYRYQQKYKGINVEGGEYIEHVIGGFVEKANGKIIRGLNLNINPSISESDAFTNALNHVNADIYMWEDVNEEQVLKEFKNDNSATYFPQPELVNYPYIG